MAQLQNWISIHLMKIYAHFSFVSFSWYCLDCFILYDSSCPSSWWFPSENVLRDPYYLYLSWFAYLLHLMLVSHLLSMLRACRGFCSYYTVGTVQSCHSGLFLHRSWLKTWGSSFQFICRVTDIQIQIQKCNPQRRLLPDAIIFRWKSNNTHISYILGLRQPKTKSLVHLDLYVNAGCSLLNSKCDY